MGLELLNETLEFSLDNRLHGEREREREQNINNEGSLCRQLDLEFCFADVLIGCSNSYTN